MSIDRSIVTLLLVSVTGLASAGLAQDEWDECAGALCFDSGTLYGSLDTSNGVDISSCGLDDFNDFWISYSPSVSGPVTLTTCSELTDFDTTMAIYDECGGTELACNDDFCDLQSQITLGMVAGQRYLIRIAGYQGETGSFVFTIDVPGIDCGDECGSAYSIPQGYRGAYTSDSSGSIDDTSCGSGDVIDAWHCFVAPESGFAVATTHDFNGYTDFDTTIAVFDDCGGTEIACSDDALGLDALVEWQITAGETYYIRVAGYQGATGVYSLTILANDLCSNPIESSGSGLFLFANGLAAIDGIGHAACFMNGEAGIDHDVWYRWRSPATGPVEIFTCDTTDLDTKLAVYHDNDACPPGDLDLIACNDDACGLQSAVVFPARINETYRLRLGTYPGTPGDIGVFTAAGPEPPCHEPPTHCQRPPESGGVTSYGSDAGIVADNFAAGVDGVLTHLCFWGIDSLDIGCTDGAPTDLVVRYYADDDGQPGATLAVFAEADGSLVLDVAASSFAGIEYFALHEPLPVAAGSCYWVGIQNLTPPPCGWHWIASDTGAGDGTAYFSSDPDNWDTPSELFDDLAFCLNLPLGDPTQCDDCPGDTNGDGFVDVTDLLFLLGAWDGAGGPADFDNSGVVDVGDLLILLGAWGPC